VEYLIQKVEKEKQWGGSEKMHREASIGKKLKCEASLYSISLQKAKKKQLILQWGACDKRKTAVLKKA